MLKQTLDLRSAVALTPNREEKLALLRNAYPGEDCYILACGPSLNQVPREELQAALGGRLVFAVKQAYEVVKGIADFHLLNAWSYQRYLYQNPYPVIVQTVHAGEPATYGHADLRLPLDNGGDTDLKYTVAARGIFDEFLLSETPTRPWGPGILLELGFYLALHLGVGRIFLLGVDSVLESALSRATSHFYDRSKPKTGVQFLVPLHMQHDAGLRYNVGYDGDETKTDAENAVVRAAMPAVRDWLNGKGVGLYRITNAPRAEAVLPELEFEDAIRLART